MIYFSEIKGKKVVTEDKIEVGKLEDFIFLASVNPKVTKIVIKDKQKKDLIISFNDIKKLNKRIIIGKAFNTVNLDENELYIGKNLLDKQIIDLIGDKIIRVNDVALQERTLLNRFELYVAGVDIGLLGILRWFGLDKIGRSMYSVLNKVFNLKKGPKFLSWADIQPLELARGKVVLKKEEKKLERIRPEDLANYLEKTNIANVRTILRMLDEKISTEVIGNLNINYQSSLIQHFKPEKSAKIISLLDPVEAVDILLVLPRKKRERIMEFVEKEKKLQLEELINFSKTAIGDALTTEYLTVSPNMTVRDTINKIKKETAEFYLLDYIYVLNEKQELIGVVNLHELIMQDLDTQIFKFMTHDLVVIHLTTPEEIAVKKMFKYKLYALPVIDKEKHLLGKVTFDNIADFLLHKI